MRDHRDDKDASLQPLPESILREFHDDAWRRPSTAKRVKPIQTRVRRGGKAAKILRRQR